MLRKIHEKLDAILAMFTDSVPRSQINVYEKQIERLEKQNKHLFDTLMSRNWDEYARLKEDHSYVVPEVELNPEDDYTNAGEIVDGR